MPTPARVRNVVDRLVWGSMVDCDPRYPLSRSLLMIGAFSLIKRAKLGGGSGLRQSLNNGEAPPSWCESVTAVTFYLAGGFWRFGRRALASH